MVLTGLFSLGVVVGVGRNGVDRVVLHDGVTALWNMAAAAEFRSRGYSKVLSRRWCVHGVRHGEVGMVSWFTTSPVSCRC